MSSNATQQPSKWKTRYKITAPGKPNKGIRKKRKHIYLHSPSVSAVLDRTKQVFGNQQ